MAYSEDKVGGARSEYGWIAGGPCARATIRVPFTIAGAPGSTGVEHSPAARVGFGDEGDDADNRTWITVLLSSTTPMCASSDGE